MKGGSSASSVTSILFWVTWVGYLCVGAGALQATIPGPNATSDALIQHSELGLGRRNRTEGCGKNTKICQVLCDLCDEFPSRMDCYTSIHEAQCFYSFQHAMESLTDTHWCTWNYVKSPYNTFTLCSEDMADCLHIPWPNQLVEETFVYIHSMYFRDCPLEVLPDAPPSVIFTLVITPICLIPVMVILVMLKTSSW
ncbi:receptor activity-modifying protein 1-like [Megalops cyprinoides]|uniref:receptor activity-modifying protein 1-like n=1 Tax=Megalops cyprinoides TaxID=118141 RepID=UPI00186490BF|nr:receptor activity-modifying protein 1-like [Megalops cyprinoides]